MLNDEWTLIDSLGYENLVQNLVTTIKKVQPPFSLGIYGGWGSGKTSLMKQVYYRVGGKTKSYLFPFSTKAEEEKINEENKQIIDELTVDLNYEAIWFNPWKHEMESNPLLTGALEILCQSDRIQYSKGLRYGNKDRHRDDYRTDTRG